MAQNLQLSSDSIERLEQLATAAIAVTAVREMSRPSEVVRLLSRYDRTLLMAIAVMSPKALRRKIWQYVHHWMNVKPLLNGNDLKALGYKPGPQFKTILDSLLAATLDGEIQSRSDAEAYLAQYFPRDSMQQP